MFPALGGLIQIGEFVATDRLGVTGRRFIRQQIFGLRRIEVSRPRNIDVITETVGRTIVGGSGFSRNAETARVRILLAADFIKVTFPGVIGTDGRRVVFQTIIFDGARRVLITALFQNRAAEFFP